MLNYSEVCLKDLVMKKSNNAVPEISVIVPIYNVQKYLNKCLDSIINQTFKDIEVVCVNDGSTDASADILAEYAAKDARIKVITQKNQGQAAARNKAMQIAKGNWVFFVDSDDFIHPQTLEMMLAIARKTGTEVVATETVKHYDERPIDTDNLQYETHDNPLLHILYNEQSGSVIWNKLYKRELIQDRPFINGIYFEDWPWVTCLFANIKEYATVPYEIYSYNTENTSTMRSEFTLKKINDFATGIRFIKQYFAEPRWVSLWPMVRKVRICASLKHLINAVYHNKKNRRALDELLFKTLASLHNEDCFYYRELNFKVLLRIIKIWFRNIKNGR